MTSEALVGPDDYPTAVRVGLRVLGVYLAVSVVIATVIAGVASATSDVIAFAKLGVMLAALGLHGQVFTSTHASSSGTFSFSGDTSVGFGFVPFLLLGLALALAYVLSSREAPSVTSRNALVRGVLSALVAVVPLAVLAAVGHLSGNAFGGNDDGATIGASIGPLLLWGTAVLALGSCAGRLATYRATSGRPSLLKALAERSQGVAPWVVAAFQSAVLSGLIIIVTGIVYGLVSSRHEVSDASNGADGSDAAVVIAAVLLIPNIVFAASGFFMGFSIHIGLFSELGAGNVGLLSGDVPAKAYLWVLAPLAAHALLGVRQALMTPTSAWWKAGVGSVVLWLPVSYLLRLDAAGLGVGFTPVSLVLLSFAWGVAMLGLGRVLVGPALDAFPRLASLQEPAPVEGYGQPLGTTVVPTAPLDPATRRKVIAGGTAVAVLVAAFVAFKVVDAKAFGPEKVVKDYYTSLSEGRVTHALSLLQSRPDASPLLVDAALPPGKRITDVKVGAVHTTGSSSYVSVTYRLQGQSSSDSVTVVKAGRRAGVFHSWKIRSIPGKLRIQGLDRVPGALVNGLDVGSAQDLPALPGLYAATFPADSPLTADESVARMEGYGGYLSVNATLSEAAKEKGRQAVLTYVRSCLAKAHALQTTCGVTSYQFADSVRAITWTLTQEPTIELSYDESAGTASTYSSGGRADVSGIAHTNGFFGQPATDKPFTEQESFFVRGTVSFTGSEAVFTPSS